LCVDDEEEETEKEARVGVLVKAVLVMLLKGAEETRRV